MYYVKWYDLVKDQLQLDVVDDGVWDLMLDWHHVDVDL